jgi:hypothetical protein
MRRAHERRINRSELADRSSQSHASSPPAASSTTDIERRSLALSTLRRCHEGRPASHHSTTLPGKTRFLMIQHANTVCEFALCTRSLPCVHLINPLSITLFPSPRGRLDPGPSIQRLDPFKHHRRGIATRKPLIHLRKSIQHP